MILPSKYQIANTTYDIFYNPQTFDHYDDGTDYIQVCWGIKKIDDFDIIVFRGSKTLEDWLRDFDALENPITDDDLGPCHPGFLAGIRESWQKIKPLISNNTIITGHSLGAARATILTAIMILDNVIPIQRIVFGEPRPGGSKLASIVSKIEGLSYRNGDSINHDLVTDLPWSFPPIEPYQHPTPLEHINIEPSETDKKTLSIFAWHALDCYIAAMKNL